MSDGTFVNKVVEDGQEATEESQAEKLPFTVRHSGVDTEEEVIVSDEIKGNEIEDADLDGDEIVDPFLAEAVKQGYDPEFEGPNKRSPYEFVEHGKVLNTIHKQNQKIRDLEENARNQSTMIQKGMDKARQETIAELKAERREAQEDGEWEKVEAIEEDIDNLKAEEVVTPEADEVVAEVLTPITTAQAQQYATDNPWMMQDKVAQDMAVSNADAYAKAYPDATGAEVLAYTDQLMRKNRPDLFTEETPAAKPARMVAGQGRAPARQAAGAKGKPKGTTYATLSSQEKRQCDLYVRSTGNTAEQYCADIDLLG